MLPICNILKIKNIYFLSWFISVVGSFCIAIPGLPGRPLHLFHFRDVHVNSSLKPLHVSHLWPAPTSVTAQVECDWSRLSREDELTASLHPFAPLMPRLAPGVPRISPAGHAVVLQSRFCLVQDSFSHFLSAKGYFGVFFPRQKKHIGYIPKHEMCEITPNLVPQLLPLCLKN